MPSIVGLNYHDAPVGAIQSFGGPTAPQGWLLCDGTSYLRTLYPQLFTAISTAFGAADGTHFNVPDLRGRFLRGVDGGSGRDPDAAGRTAMNAGGATGNNVGSIQSHNFGAHNHSVPVADPISGILMYDAKVAQPNSAINNANFIAHNFGNGAPFAEHVTAAGAPIFNQGGNETRPLNAYAQYIIKFQ